MAETGCWKFIGEILEHRPGACADWVQWELNGYAKVCVKGVVLRLVERFYSAREILSTKHCCRTGNDLVHAPQGGEAGCGDFGAGEYNGGRTEARGISEFRDKLTWPAGAAGLETENNITCWV